MAQPSSTLSKPCGTTSEFPLMLEVARAEGVYIYDTHGKAYIDLIAGIGVSSLGHCHANVVKAGQGSIR